MLKRLLRSLVWFLLVLLSRNDMLFQQIYRGKRFCAVIDDNYAADEALIRRVCDVALKGKMLVVRTSGELVGGEATAAMSDCSCHTQSRRC